MFHHGQSRLRRMPGPCLTGQSPGVLHRSGLPFHTPRGESQSHRSRWRKLRRVLGHKNGVCGARKATRGGQLGRPHPLLLSTGVAEKFRNATSYLFDLIEARANLFGLKTFEELVEVMPALSLKTQGWLDKPCAPLLLVNGREDKQVPIEDFFLLLETGNPKTIRLFPGGHMGESPDIFPTIL